MVGISHVQLHNASVLNNTQGDIIAPDHVYLNSLYRVL